MVSHQPSTFSVDSSFAQFDHLSIFLFSTISRDHPLRLAGRGGLRINDRVRRLHKWYIITRRYSRINGQEKMLCSRIYFSSFDDNKTRQRKITKRNSNVICTSFEISRSCQWPEDDQSNPSGQLFSYKIQASVSQSESAATAYNHHHHLVHPRRKVEEEEQDTDCSKYCILCSNRISHHFNKSAAKLCMCTRIMREEWVNFGQHRSLVWCDDGSSLWDSITGPSFGVEYWSTEKKTSPKARSGSYYYYRPFEPVPLHRVSPLDCPISVLMVIEWRQQKFGPSMRQFSL